MLFIPQVPKRIVTVNTGLHFTTSFHKSQPEFYCATLVRLSCENVHKCGAYPKTESALCMQSRADLVRALSLPILRYMSTSSTRLYYSITPKKGNPEVHYFTKKEVCVQMLNLTDPLE